MLVQAILCTGNVTVNFIIIYKYYKCDRMAFISEICWLINLDNEATVFQFTTQKLFNILWHFINTLLFICLESGSFSNSHSASCFSNYLTKILHTGIIRFLTTMWLILWKILSATKLPGPFLQDKYFNQTFIFRF